MKLNNKGFLLAETIVTVCIIATLATSMYLYVSKTASRFEERDSYENVVDVYKANTLKKYLKEKDILNAGEVNFTNDENLKNIQETLNIKSAYIITKRDDIDTTGNNKQALKDYLNWINIDGDPDDLRLIVWFKGEGEGDGTFANLLIK